LDFYFYVITANFLRGEKFNVNCVTDDNSVTNIFTFISNKFMAISNLSFKNFFNAGDILAVLVIIAGALIAVFLDDIAIKMIGISVALLGVVALFMLVSGRLSDIVDSNAIKKKNTNNSNVTKYKLTTIQDEKGVRKTVEDYDLNYEDDNFVPFPLSEQIPINIDNTSNTIKKIDTIVAKQENNDSNQSDSQKTNSDEIKPEKPQIDKTMDFVDGTSSVRIIGKIKKEKVEEKISTPNEDKIKAQSTTTIAKKVEEKSLKEELTTKKEEVLPISVQDEKNKQEKSNRDNSKEIEEFPTNYFFETDMLIGEEPKLEFEYFISRILLIIKSVTDSNSVLLVLVDNKSENFSIEAFTTDKDKTIEAKKKIPVSNDIISQIIQNAKPEILSEINPSAIKDLIPYYSNEVEIQSFIGIPVVWNDGVIGVMCADSISKDCFDSATVSFMGQFSKLVSGLVKSYTHKIDLLQAAKSLDIISRFENIVLNDTLSKNELYATIVNEVKGMFVGYTVGIATYDYDSESWSVNIYDDGKQVINNIDIDFNSSILGKCIIDGDTIYLSGIDIVNIKRVFSKEIKFLSGEFLATPLRTNNGTYGAIIIESAPQERLTDFDISIMQVLSNHLAITLERFNLINLYRSSCIVDRSSGLYNNTAFYKRLNEEIARFEETENSNLTLCMFKVDKYAVIDPQKHSDRLEIAINNALEIAKKYTKKYEIMGRIDSETFAIIFINHSSHDLKLIAERFRNDVANSIIEFDNAKFSVTISIGLANYQKQMGVKNLVSHSINALTRSLQFQNHVQLYN